MRNSTNRSHLNIGHHLGQFNETLEGCFNSGTLCCSVEKGDYIKALTRNDNQFKDDESVQNDNQFKDDEKHYKNTG
jgi:hypothetical protein